MKVIKKILLKVYMVWVLFIFTFFMVLLLPVMVIPILLGQKYGNIAYGGIYAWAWIFSQLTFIRYKIIGRENINRKSSYIYCSNHTSFLDLPGLRLGIPTQFRPLAKKELLKIPVFNLIIRVATVIVDRSSAKSRKESIDILKERTKSGISILIFPEGTQNRTDKLLQPFYDGAFRLAIETGRPVIPTVIVNAGNLMPPSSISVRPGTIKIIFGKPIDTIGHTIKETALLKEQVFDKMIDLIKQNNQ